MKSTGIVRPIDKLGRVVIPKELRQHYQLDEMSQLEIYTTEEGILLKPYKLGCDLCGEILINDVVVFKGKKLCSRCIQQIKEEL